ncbi:MAG TPA: helix-turn-helix domain-containing protein [bacterium]|nr:helix-turn-helix domain-containing protein [bacterium]
MTTRAAGRHEWMTLSEACAYLGVDASTLRTWVDAGRVPAYRTPGGHRRFDRAALEAFLARSQREPPRKLAELIGPHAARLVPGALARVQRQRWYRVLDGPTARAMGEICRGLMEALADYLRGGSRQKPALQAGAEAGDLLGRQVARLGLTAAEATEAFLFFKGIITDAVSTRLPLSPEGRLRSIRRIDRFLDRVLLRMMAAVGAPPE